MNFWAYDGMSPSWMRTVLEIKECRVGYIVCSLNRVSSLCRTFSSGICNFLEGPLTWRMKLSDTVIHFWRKKKLCSTCVYYYLSWGKCRSCQSIYLVCVFCVFLPAGLICLFQKQLLFLCFFGGNHSMTKYLVLLVRAVFGYFCEWDVVEKW